MLSGTQQRGRILYVQFTNPAGYPPLEHSSRILAESGFDVVFLGTGAVGADGLQFPPHPKIRIHKMRFVQSGSLQKVAYILYCLWVFSWCLLWRPGVVYGSDPFSCLPMSIASKILNCLVIYHEHDSPGDTMNTRSVFMRMVYWARTHVAKTAALRILPNAGRAAWFQESMHCGETTVVWNCPRRDEAVVERGDGVRGPLKLYYHGSLAVDLLPMSVLRAMAGVPEVVLRFAGYETVGSQGYVSKFLEEADSLGIGDRVQYLGSLSRHEVLARCREHDLGLLLISSEAMNRNLQNLVGASNKAFDYLACGLALVVPNRVDWIETYVEPGYAVPCDPTDSTELAGYIQWFVDRRECCKAMGEAGRQRILAEWNYETQFRDVLAEIVRRSE